MIDQPLPDQDNGSTLLPALLGLVAAEQRLLDAIVSEGLEDQPQMPDDNVLLLASLGWLAFVGKAKSNLHPTALPAETDSPTDLGDLLR